ncbi:Peptidoglycan-binding protein, CsiV [Sulfurivirga caldicuralii]|uniref:Peptidoglycan-binding protein, CsiV n=1 Tax=Sulfurivirga caldicuralii TaxID=364032 RepID=A0A1N6F7L0_9GAMM|nr:CsiV family protein [Sulfurivirga caldicuralii]SIN91247.1 Peptidoglycan-binding protein, CsiV [Sulfurivirga caldicuralii]
MIKKLFPLFITFLVLASGNARAAEKVPLYQVEVLVFTTGALQGWTEEYWPWPDELKMDTLEDGQNALTGEPAQHDHNGDGHSTVQPQQAGEQLHDTQNSTPLQQVPPVSSPFILENSADLLLDDLLAGQFPESAPTWIREIRAVPTEHSLLQKAVERLSPQKGYRIVSHYSWIQPAINKKQALDFTILGNTPFGDALTGQVRFYKNRHGHIELSLDMERRIPQKIREAFARHEGLEPDELPDTWTFHLSETRKVKSNEWHYFDHPLFGALAVIRRVSTGQ